MSFEKARELAACCHLLAARIPVEVNDITYSDDNHTLIANAKRVGLLKDAAAVQQLSRQIAQISADVIATLADIGINPKATLTGWEDQTFIPEIVAGRLPLHDGVRSVLLFDVSTLILPIPKPLFYKSYVNDIEHTNIIPTRGASIFDWLVASKVGQRNLQCILSKRKVRLAFDIYKSRPATSFLN
jgi:hypothetical protein